MPHGLRGWLVLGAACAVLNAQAGCGQASQVSRVTPSSVASASRTPTGVTASHSPSPRTQTGLPVAILVHHERPDIFGASASASYSIALVAADASVVATASPRLPSSVTFTYTNCPVFGGSPTPTCQIAFRPRAPLVTSSNTRAYYLDGDSDIGYLAPDGRTGTAVRLPANPQVRYAVAVSPDDSRMAVAAFDYQGAGTFGNPSVKLSIYVQDLAGGNRVDLFSSSTVSEWPIGWHDGHLVIAVGPGAVVQYTVDNPYFAVDGYHVADATTGVRLATVARDCVYGPVVRAGAPCIFNDSTQNVLGYRSWDSSRHSFVPQPDPNLQPLALAPNGTRLAGTTLGPPENSHLDLISASGITALDVKGIVQGWLDNEHVVYFTVGSSKSFILDVVTGVSAAVPQTNPPGDPGSPSAYLQFLGTVPQQMS